MALEVTYYTGADGATGQCLGYQISRATVTLSGSSATLGAVPPGARIAHIVAGEACVVSNNGLAASATNGQYFAASDKVDIAVPVNEQPFYGKTA